MTAIVVFVCALGIALVSAWPASALLEPETTITDAPADPTNSTGASFSFESSVIGSTFECQLDGGGWEQGCTSPRTYSSLSPGQHTFEVRATDEAPPATTDPSPATHTWTIDTSPPGVTITNGPANPTNSTGASFTFNSSDSSATFECQLDGGGFAACTSPEAYSGLSPGSHTFQVRAKDAAGNVGGADTHNWTIDTTAPTATITGNPSNPTSETSASFSFTSNDSTATFQCQLDGGGFSTCIDPESYSGLSPGSHTFQVRARDGAGNTGSPDSYTWTIDTSAPTATITNFPQDPSGSTSASFSFTSNDSGATFECRIDGGGFVPCTSPEAYSGLSPGSHTFEVRAKDGVGNTGSADSYTWTIDTTAPTATITNTPSNPSGSTSASFSFTADEGGVTFECQLDSGGFSGCTSPKSYSTLAPTTHTFQVRAKDAAGNTGSPDSYTWTIDTSAPSATIISGPANPTASTSASFSFISDDSSASFECKLDGASFSTCADPASYLGLSGGTHTFQVRATDSLGNTGGADTYTWTIDTTAPTATITNTPLDPSGSTSASFSFNSPDSGATFECQLDGGGFSACTSPKGYTGLGAGGHTFQVRAKDSVGNIGPADSFAWTIDTTAPDVTITNAPANPTASTNASFSFNSSDSSASFQCQLDGGGFSACTSPKSYTSLAATSHTFQVRATDNAGNASSPVSHTWTIDTSAPTATIISGPANPTNSTSASFSFTSDDSSASFECKLDGASFSACTDPAGYLGLSAGSHTFQVRAKDGLGNTGSADTYTWTIDTTAPTTTITNTPTDPSGSTSASFSFSSPDSGATFQCQLDSGGYSTCTSPKAYTGLGAGSHTFQVLARDSVGNIGPADSYTWTIDTTAPDVTITNAPANPTASTNASFSFNSSDSSASFQCQLDGGGFSACTSPKSYTGLAAATHTFQVRATDSVGNVSAAATHTWTIDTSAPTATITNTPTNPSGSTSPSFSFTADDAGATFECQLDGSGFSACAAPKSYTGLGAGSHTFQVRAKDGLGNTGAADTYTWTIDTTAPDVTITNAPANPTASTSASFSFNSADSGATFECQLDGGGFSACITPKSYTGLAATSHTFQVRAKDSVGNIGPADSYTWTVDTAAPDLTITGTPPNPTNSSAASFSFSSSDSSASFQCQLDGGGFSACTSPKSYTGLAATTHTFQVRATDGVGNSSAPATYTWTIDTSAPSVTITNGPSGHVSSTTAVFEFSSTATDIARFECRLEAPATFTPCNSGVGYSVGEGQHTFFVRAVDTAGNTSAPVSQTWTVDTGPPVTSINSGPPPLTNSTSATFTFSSNEAGSGVQCQLDGGGWTACSSSSSHSYSGLSGGTHTFQVRAIDQAGNVDSNPPSHTWTIDVTSPDVTIGAPVPANPTNSTTATFNFSSSDFSASFECQLDGGAFAPCSSPKTYAGLSSGAHTFQVRAKDTAGNTGAASSYTWTVDTAAPTVVIGAPVPADPTNLRSATFNFSSSDATATFECQLDTGAWEQNCLSAKSYPGPLSAASHTFRVRAKDVAGNTGPEDTYTWTIDISPPHTAINSGPSGPITTGSVTYTFSSPDEPNATFDCALDGGTFGACSGPGNSHSANVPDGAHTFHVRARDPAGNADPSPESRSFTVDTLEPQTLITEGPIGPTNLSRPTFRFTSPDDPNATFECAIDSPSFGTCLGPAGSHTPPSALAQGAHTFRVRAKDASNRVDLSPEERTFTVDTVRPQTTITVGPAQNSMINTSSASFEFSSSEPTNATFLCSMDAADPLDYSLYGPCTSPAPYAGLTEGQHVFRVVAADQAGNQDASPAARTFTVDLTAPDTFIDQAPQTPTNSRSLQFRFSSTEPGSTFECKLDGPGAVVGGFAPCGNAQGAHTFNLTADSSYTLNIRAIDQAGNPDPFPIPYAFTVDTAKPASRIDSGPTSVPCPDPCVTSSTSASFSFSLVDSSETLQTFQCKLDAQDYTPCTSPQSYPTVTPGPHTFKVRAIDQAGNVEDVTIPSKTWEVDTNAPHTTISVAPRSPTDQRSAKFEFASNKPNSTFQCKVNSGQLHPCQSPKTYPNLPEGENTFTVRATDALGNPDPQEAAHTWIIDVTNPQTTIVSSPPATTTSGFASFAFTSELDATFECRLDSGAWAACQSPKIYGELVVGQHTFEVRAVDQAGNRDQSPATRNWTVVAPAPPPPAAATSTGPSLISPFPVIRIAGSITRSGVRLRLFLVNSPAGSKITVRCSGRRCPFKKQSRAAFNEPASTPQARVAKVLRIRSLEKRFYPAGVKLEVFVTKPGMIGKYTRFKIRKGKAPARIDRCLMPGTTKPVRCAT